MKFIADEGVDAPIVSALRNKGYDVLYILELSPGKQDDVILSEANSQNRILLTQDKDFGELVFRLRQIHSGVVLIRLHGIKPLEKAIIVTTALEKHLNELYNAFTVIQKNAVRIKPKQ
jgi:predicted nuclease of predicted toxin-antitoxin system